MKRANKYRIYPTKSQISKLNNTFSMCRYLYNWSLGERIVSYQLRKHSLFIEKHLKGKKETLSSCMGQLLFPEEKEPVVINLLSDIEGIFGIQFTSVWESVPRYVNYTCQQNNLPSLKKSRPWFTSVYSQVLQNVLRRVDFAYENFYRRLREGREKVGFPKFRKRGQWNSITYTQQKKPPEGNIIRVPKIGDIKIVYHRPISQKAIIKTLTITREGCKWFACFSYEMVHPHIEPEQDLSNSIGIDLGLIDFYYGSDGSKVEVPKYLRKSEKGLKKLQRRFSGAERGSKKHSKLLKSLQKAHYRVKCKRWDFLHKTANGLLNKYDVIIHEDLSIRNMSRRPKVKQDEEGTYLPNGASRKSGLNKSICDAGWYKFTQILKYKALVMGKTVIAVDPKYTSQVCSSCGNIVEKSLSTRTHICPYCGLILPRDYNSALYIKRLGLESQSRVALEAPSIL